MMKHLLRLLAVLFLFIIGVSCSNDDNNAPNTDIVTYQATFKVLSSTPTSAKGNATVLFNQTSKTFQITINYEGITPKLARVYASNSTLIFDLENIGTTSPIIKTLTMSDAQIADFIVDYPYVTLTEPSSTAESTRIGGELVKK